jgi:hypothetical protein
MLFLLLDPSQIHAKYGSLFLAIPGVFSLIPPIGAWAANNSDGHYRRATAIAFSYSTSTVGGILSTWVSFSENSSDLEMRLQLADDNRSHVNLGIAFPSFPSPEISPWYHRQSRLVSSSSFTISHTFTRSSHYLSLWNKQSKSLSAVPEFCSESQSTMHGSGMQTITRAPIAVGSWSLTILMAMAWILTPQNICVLGQSWAINIRTLNMSTD